MTTCRLVLGWLVIVVALVPAAQKEGGEGRSGKKSTQGARKPRQVLYKTPQAVFEAYLTAGIKGDGRTFVGCISPGMVKEQAANTALGALIDRDRAQREGDEKRLTAMKKVSAILDKHGLTRKAFKGEPDDGQILDILKDPEAFLIEIAPAIRQAEGWKGPLAIDKLTDVKIEGDYAEAFFSDVRMAFVRVGGSWKVASRDWDSPPPRRPTNPKRRRGPDGP